MIKQPSLKLMQGLLKEYMQYLRGTNKDFFKEQTHPHIIVAKKGLDIFKQSVQAYVRQQFKGKQPSEVKTLQKMVEINEARVQNRHESIRVEPKHQQIVQKKIQQKVEKNIQQVNAANLNIKQQIKEEKHQQRKKQKEEQEEDKDQFYSCNGSPTRQFKIQNQQDGIETQQIKYPSNFTQKQRQKEQIKPEPASEESSIVIDASKYFGRQQQISSIMIQSQHLDQSIDPKKIKQELQNKIFASICQNVASFSIKSKQQNEQPLTKIIKLINFTQKTFRNTNEPDEQNLDIERIKIGRRIIDILSEVKVKRIRELSKIQQSRNILRVECEELAQRIDVLY